MKKTSRQANQEKWFLRIEQFLAKDISQESYCQTEGLKKGTFMYWLKKYRSSSNCGEPSRSGFIALRAVQPPSLEEEITLRVGAVEVSLPARHDLESLIALIKALA